MIRRFVMGYLRSADSLLLLTCILLSTTSVILLLGLSNTGYATIRQVQMQMITAAGGMMGAIILSKLDYNMLAGLWKLYLPLSYGLVLSTFVVGRARGDDQAWLEIFGFSLQPSEILKIAFILGFALHIVKAKEHINELRTLALLCIHGAIPVLIVHFQGDDGTAIIFAAVFAAMIFCAGISWKYIIAAIGAVAVAAPLLWFFVLNQDQKSRILITFNPELDPLHYGYQQLNGLLAIGSGQLVGNGIFSGQHIRIPEIRNDYIFAFLGEATGFMGCLGVILLLAFLCCRTLLSAIRAKDDLGKFICIGVFAMLACQSIMNIGMCLSVLPVIGVTLPFLSAGGTSMLAVYAGIGLVLSVHMQSNSNMFIS